MNDFIAQLPRTRARRRRAAFTLLELLLVLLVLAVLASIALPSLLGLERSQGAKSFAADLVIAARYARNQSVAEGVSYRLNVDPANARFWLTRFDRTDFVALGNEAGREHRAPDGVGLEWDAGALGQALVDGGSATGQIETPRLASDLPFIEFFPSGRVDPSVVRVVDREGRVTQIVHPSATESVRMIKPDGTVVY